MARSLSDIEVKMRGIVLGTTLAIAALLATACTSDSGSPATETATSTAPTSTSAMTKYLDGLVEVHQFRGAVEVRLGDEVLLSSGFDRADTAGNAPNEPDTRFRIGSLTKQFTALAVLILQEQGKLQTSDLLCTHLPTCPTAWRAITIEHLLTHTAGLYDYVEISGGDAERYATAFGPAPTPAQLIQFFVDKPLEFPPGSKHDYSSSGYILLGALVEQLSGKTYGEFLTDEILTPLGMSDTGYQPDRPADDRDATGYQNWTTTSPKAPDAVSFSGGGVCSTVTDLARWNQFLLTGSPAVVEPDTLAQLLEPRVAAEGGTRYGYGIYTLGTGDATSHFHGGNVPGFAAYNEIRPAAELSIVVLSNLDTTDTRSIAENLAALATT